MTTVNGQFQHRRRSVPRGSRRNGGFALVIVIWGIGIVALLIVSLMTTARLRLQAAANIAAAARAEWLAEAAINRSLLALATEASASPGQNAPVVSGVDPALTAQRPIHDGRPRLCRLGDAAVTIAIADESGKVDLNGASQDLLKAMLTGFGIARGDADSAANAIVAFRSAPGDAPAGAASILAPDAKHAYFQTIFELDQVGLSAEMVRDILPFVTVHSQRSGVNAEAAPPALFAALVGYAQNQVDALRAAPFPNALDRGDPRFPATFKQNGASGVFLVHAEALLPSGQMGVKEIVVDLNAGAGSGDALFAIRELRRGSPRYAIALRFAAPEKGALPDC